MKLVGDAPMRGSAHRYTPTPGSALGMTSATRYSSGAVVLEEVEFTYDVFNRRIAKMVDADGAGPGLPATRYTVYDGAHRRRQSLPLSGQ
jgi:hypothetical protein